MSSSFSRSRSPPPTGLVSKLAKPFFALCCIMTLALGAITAHYALQRDDAALLTNTKPLLMLPWRQ